MAGQSTERSREAAGSMDGGDQEMEAGACQAAHLVQDCQA